MWSRFKEWFKRSGINYLYGDKIGEKIIDNLNPFDFRYTAREIRNNPLKSTTPFYPIFDVLMGDHFDLDEKGHGRIGILDILIFPLISRRLVAYAYNQKNNPVLRFSAFIPAAILEFVRGCLGVLLMLVITSPLIVLLVAVGVLNCLYGIFIQPCVDCLRCCTSLCANSESQTSSRLTRSPNRRVQHASYQTMADKGLLIASAPVSKSDNGPRDLPPAGNSDALGNPEFSQVLVDAALDPVLDNPSIKNSSLGLG